MATRYFISQSGTGKVTTTEEQYRNTIRQSRWTEVSKKTYSKYWEIAESQAQEYEQKKLYDTRERLAQEAKQMKAQGGGVRVKEEPKQYYTYVVEQFLNYGATGRGSRTEYIPATATPIEPKGQKVPILAAVNPISGQVLTSEQVKSSPVIASAPAIGYRDKTTVSTKESTYKPKESSILAKYRATEEFIASKTTKKVLPQWDTIKDYVPDPLSFTSALPSSVKVKILEKFDQKGATKTATEYYKFRGSVQKGAYEDIRQKPVTNVLTFAGGFGVGKTFKAAGWVKPFKEVSKFGKSVIVGGGAVFAGAVGYETYKAPTLESKGEVIGKGITRFSTFTAGYGLGVGKAPTKPINEKPINEKPINVNSKTFKPSDYFVERVNVQGGGSEFYAVSRATGQKTPISKGDIHKFKPNFMLKPEQPTSSKFSLFGSKKGSMALTPKTPQFVTTIEQKTISPVIGFIGTPKIPATRGQTTPTRSLTTKFTNIVKPSRSIDIYRSPTITTKPRQELVTKKSRNVDIFKQSSTSIVTKLPRDIIPRQSSNIITRPKTDIIQKPTRDIIRKPTTDITTRKTDIIERPPRDITIGDTPAKGGTRPGGSGGGMFPDIPIPPFFGWGSANFGGGGGLLGSGRFIGYRGKGKRQYSPSISSLTFDIRGSKPRGILSGLEQRPIPTGDGKSKKKKKQKSLV